VRQVVEFDRAAQLVLIAPNGWVNKVRMDFFFFFSS
jgi:hypothetical protein